MNMLEWESSMSGMDNAFAAQRMTAEMTHQNMAPDTGVKLAQTESGQAANVALAQAVTGLGSKLDITV